MSHVDPLPEELATLRTAAAAAHSANAAHVDSILSRLERARHLLADTHASPGDELLSLGSYLKTTNADSAAAHKDWGTAVAKLQKSVDKVRSLCPLSSQLSRLIMFVSTCTEIRPSTSPALPASSATRPRAFLRTSVPPCPRPQVRLRSRFRLDFRCSSRLRCTFSLTFRLTGSDRRLERNHRESSRPDWRVRLA